jgi:hypothetical protein
LPAHRRIAIASIGLISRCRNSFRLPENNNQGPANSLVNFQSASMLNPAHGSPIFYGGRRRKVTAFALVKEKPRQFINAAGLTNEEIQAYFSKPSLRAMCKAKSTTRLE